MSSRQVKLYTTETAGGTKTSTTTINNVNPEVSGTLMLNLARKLNDFTTNTYARTDLVETTNLDTESVKVILQIAIVEGSGAISGNNITFRITTNQSIYGDPSVITGFAMKDGTIYTINQTSGVGFRINGANTNGTYDLYIGIPEQTIYTAAFIHGTLTLSS